MKQKLLFLLALAFVSISAMGQVTFTAIGGSDFDDGEGSKMAKARRWRVTETSTPNGASEATTT